MTINSVVAGDCCDGVGVVLGLVVVIVVVVCVLVASSKS